MQFPKDIYYGNEVTIDLYQEGDIIDAVWLRLVFPPGLTATVCDSFGTYVLNWVQLEYEGRVIERLHGEYIEIMYDTDVSQGKQAALQNFIGKGLTTPLTTYTVKLPFNILRTGLPVCALDKNPILRFNIRNFSDCGTGVAANPQFNATLLVDYVFLEEKERNFFIENELTYLIEQTQFVNINFPKPQYSQISFTLPDLTTTASSMAITVPSTANINFKIVFVTVTAPADTSALTVSFNSSSMVITSSLITGEIVTVTCSTQDISGSLTYSWPGTAVTSMTVSTDGVYIGGPSNPMIYYTQFQNPCKEIFFVFQRVGAQPYDYTLDGTNDILSALRFKLGTVDYLKFDFSNSLFLRNLADHVRRPTRLFYNYSLRGPINMSMAERQQFDFLVNYTATLLVVRMYMRSYNVVKVCDGTLVVLYDCPTDTMCIAGQTGFGETPLLPARNPYFVLSNPGTTSLNTVVSQQTVSLTLTNPYSVTPIWSYPTLAGVTWTSTNTGISFTAAQDSSLSTQNITVTAIYGPYIYPQTFSLTIDNNPQLVLSNPGTQSLDTSSSSRSVILTLTNPYSVTPTWSYPTLAGVTWSSTNTGITLTAPQITALPTQDVTVTAIYKTYSYPQTFSLTISGNPQFVLSNPGTTILDTTSSPQPLSLTLTNPFSVTPTWSYPTITDVTWSTTNTGITLTAAQGSAPSVQDVTITASFGTYSYPQTFTLAISGANQWTSTSSINTLPAVLPEL
jgi:hypothetical protein